MSEEVGVRFDELWISGKGLAVVLIPYFSSGSIPQHYHRPSLEARVSSDFYCIYHYNCLLHGQFT